VTWTEEVPAPIAFHPFTSPSGDDRRVHFSSSKGGRISAPLREDFSRIRKPGFGLGSCNGVWNGAGDLGAFSPWRKLERDDYDPHQSFPR